MSDRGVSVTVNYVLTLAITALLLSGLFVAAGSLMQSQSERAIQNQLDVLGERLAADLASADRLAQSAEGEAASVRLTVALPRRVAGAGYAIEIAPDPESEHVELTLTTSDPAVESTTRVATAHDVTVPSRLRGGDLRIEYASGSERLEVTSA
ncbi:DUF7266 family protein [Halalkalicoccus jeotgali]|uniref:Flagellin n=1 Tax=Halalkalicoccus jeotgali (strain DSM 18796 / CECT 7217 / JCM 14584 / KCTC 4019 / B3) TaxID=795797 RepID=D8J4U7_HALJB|nr:hypothetical protein [Halalkalicoccus jeotgali]ADJ15564.1 hypothetical protein HacjB3_10905 [Halalkalicoccus jeotgali B3]ELY36028.1 hypothetical protein C497_11767 [Halalkalicoccus jeotgali B3]